MNRTDTVQESTRKRRRWGCTCGCLFVFLCLALALAGLAIYTFRELQPSPKERWLAPSTIGFAVLRVNPDDSGITDMIRHQVKQLEESEGKRMTDKDRKNLHAVVGAVQQFVTGFIHKDVYLFLYTDAGAEQPEWLCVVQFRRLASYYLVQAMLDSTGEPPSEKISGATLYLPTHREGVRQSGFGITRKAMLFASSPDTLRKALTPVVEKGASNLPPDNVMQYIDELSVEQPPEGEDVAGVAANAENRLETLTRLIAKSTSSEDIELQLNDALKQSKMSMGDVLAASVTGDVASADKARLDFSFHCRQPELAKKLTEVLRRQIVPAIDASRSNPSGVTAKSEASQKNSRAVLSVEFSGLKSLGKPAPEAKP